MCDGLRVFPCPLGTVVRRWVQPASRLRHPQRCSSTGGCTDKKREARIDPQARCFSQIRAKAVCLCGSGHRSVGACPRSASRRRSSASTTSRQTTARYTVKVVWVSEFTRRAIRSRVTGGARAQAQSRGQGRRWFGLCKRPLRSQEFVRVRLQIAAPTPHPSLWLRAPKDDTCTPIFRPAEGTGRIRAHRSRCRRATQQSRSNAGNVFSGASCGPFFAVGKSSRSSGCSRSRWKPSATSVAQRQRSA
jgi:hypothetical protein